MNQDFKEFIESLNANKVEYLVVGGYAVAFHGHPRYTKDLDIWVNPTEENADRLIKAIHDFGFEGINLAASDFKIPDQIIQLGYPPIRIDIITSIDGLVDFAKCFQQKNIGYEKDLEINYIDLESLKINKKASNRNQDLADLENL